MSKKVLIFSTAYFPLVGGAEVAIKEISNRCLDFRFDMITARLKKDLPKFEQIGRIKVYRVGRGNFLDKFLLPILGYFQAVKLNKKNKYNLIWVMMASQASVAASFFKILHPKIKLLLTLQEGDEENHLKRYVFKIDFLYKILIRPWHILVFKKADYIQTISFYLKKRAIENRAKCPIKIVPNAVSTAHFSQNYSKEELDKLKKELGKKDDDKYVITTSRLVLKNAVDDVIKSLQYLPNNIKFLVLGDGSDKDKLKAQSEKLKVSDRVKFLGLVDHKIMPKYLKVSDIFIRPSLSEGFGNSFIEAMAAEIPVIATQEGGIADFLFDSERNPDKKSTGWAVDKRDPKGIARAIKKILDNQEQTKQTVENAKKMAFEKYDWNIIAKDMEDIFKKITKK